MKTRVLQFATPTGDKEYVVFTEDLKVDIERWRRPGFSSDSDNAIDVAMPRDFPLDRLLWLIEN